MGILAYALLYSWAGRESSEGTFREKVKEDLSRVAVGFVLYLAAVAAAVVTVNITLGLLLAPFNAIFESDLAKALRRVEWQILEAHAELQELMFQDAADDDDVALLMEDLEEELDLLWGRRRRLEAKIVWPDWPKEAGQAIQDLFPAAFWLYAHVAALRQRERKKSVMALLESHRSGGDGREGAVSP